MMLSQQILQQVMNIIKVQSQYINYCLSGLAQSDTVEPVTLGTSESVLIRGVATF